jgi:hypothetical protein
LKKCRIFSHLAEFFPQICSPTVLAPGNSGSIQKQKFIYPNPVVLIFTKKLGIKLICGPGPQEKDFHIHGTNILIIIGFKWTIKYFLNIGAAHAKGLRHPPICLFETIFSCNCPFKNLKKQEQY